MNEPTDTQPAAILGASITEKLHKRAEDALRSTVEAALTVLFDSAHKAAQLSESGNNPSKRLAELLNILRRTEDNKAPWPWTLLQLSIETIMHYTAPSAREQEVRGFIQRIDQIGDEIQELRNQ